jgi:hypothetical protein
MLLGACVMLTIMLTIAVMQVMMMVMLLVLMDMHTRLKLMVTTI